LVPPFGVSCQVYVVSMGNGPSEVLMCSSDALLEITAGLARQRDTVNFRQTIGMSGVYATDGI